MTILFKKKNLSFHITAPDCPDSTTALLILDCKLKDEHKQYTARLTHSKLK
jgi:hypothetical protein